MLKRFSTRRRVEACRANRVFAGDRFAAAEFGRPDLLGIDG